MHSRFPDSYKTRLEAVQQKKIQAQKQSDPATRSVRRSQDKIGDSVEGSLTVKFTCISRQFHARLILTYITRHRNVSSRLIFYMNGAIYGTYLAIRI
jgi:hypothetical protein